MSTAIEALIPELQGPCRELLNLAGTAGVQPRITSTLRTHTEQARLYKRFLSGGSAFPAAPPGQSAHEFGYAFDMVVVGQDNQQDLGTVWMQAGGVWHMSDPIHFQYPGFSPPAVEAVAEPVAGAYQSAISTAKDIAAGFIPGYGTFQTAVDLAEILGIPVPDAAALLASPSKLVAQYPWLRYLGPPFVFF